MSELYDEYHDFDMAADERNGILKKLQELDAKLDTMLRLAMEGNDMGVYDEYCGVQIKIGDRHLRSYKIGDAVDIDDGVYVGWEGVIVITEGKLAFHDTDIVTKTGIRVPAGRWLKSLYRMER